ncbi:hypothetical protein [Tropicibacter sp. S64]|uniref:hypothetical protein n=1 Tax=Tropicibacter sp. S64 TaxID=3415122 RepID=UPI003C7C76A1
MKGMTLCLNLLAAGASAQTDPTSNVFFGFDFVLHPIAVKWACGGAREGDLSGIEALAAAFPKDAEATDLHSLVEALSDVPEGQAGLSRLLGFAVSTRQVSDLCAAARPLTLDWLTPEGWARGDEDAVPPEQRAAWEAFYRVVEGLR